MIKNKKGVELASNTMIIIVLALLVLIVLVFILYKSGSSANTTTSCQAHGGTCETSCSAKQGTDISGWLCGSGKICCVPSDKILP